MFFGSIAQTDRTKRMVDDPDPKFTVVAGIKTGEGKVRINAAATKKIGLGNRCNLDIFSNKAAIEANVVDGKPSSELKAYLKEAGLSFIRWQEGDLTQSPITYCIGLAPVQKDAYGNTQTVRDKRLPGDMIAELVKEKGYNDESQLTDEDYPIVDSYMGFRMSTSDIKTGVVGYDLSGTDSKNWKDMGGNADNHIIYAVGDGVVDDTSGVVMYPLTYSDTVHKIVKGVGDEVEETTEA